MDLTDTNSYTRIYHLFILTSTSYAMRALLWCVQHSIFQNFGFLFLPSFGSSIIAASGIIFDNMQESRNMIHLLSPCEQLLDCGKLTPVWVERVCHTFTVDLSSKKEEESCANAATLDSH